MLNGGPDFKNTVKLFQFLCCNIFWSQGDSLRSVLHWLSLPLLGILLSNLGNAGIPVPRPCLLHPVRLFFLLGFYPCCMETMSALWEKARGTHLVHVLSSFRSHSHWVLPNFVPLNSCLLSMFFQLLWLLSVCKLVQWKLLEINS